MRRRVSGREIERVPVSEYHAFMKRLSGLDASFLYFETPAQLLHVCGLLVLQPDSDPEGYSFGAMKARMARQVEQDPGVPPEAPARPARPRPPGVDRRRALRRRPARAPARPADTGRTRGAHRSGGTPRRHPAGPFAPAVGHVGHRGPRRRPHRGVPQDAPRHRRRHFGHGAARAPVHAWSRSCRRPRTDEAAEQAKRGIRTRASWSCSPAPSCATAHARSGWRSSSPRRSVRWQAPWTGPARAPRWRRP